MDWVAHNGHIEVVKYLHLNRSEGCKNALCYAAFKCHFEVVKYLVENELGIHYIQDAIDEAKRYGYKEIVKYLERI